MDVGEVQPTIAPCDSDYYQSVLVVDRLFGTHHSPTLQMTVTLGVLKVGWMVESREIQYESDFFNFCL